MTATDFHSHTSTGTDAQTRTCRAKSMGRRGFRTGGPSSEVGLGAGRDWLLHPHARNMATHKAPPFFKGSTHIFEQGSNVGCHQQYSRALRRCQLPCHGSSSQVGLGRARRRSEVEKRGDGEGGGGVNKRKPASACSQNCLQGWECVRGGRVKATRLEHFFFFSCMYP